MFAIDKMKSKYAKAGWEYQFKSTIKELLFALGITGFLSFLGVYGLRKDVIGISKLDGSIWVYKNNEVYAYENPELLEVSNR